jgi:hypothetical protein
MCLLTQQKLRLKEALASRNPITSFFDKKRAGAKANTAAQVCGLLMTILCSNLCVQLLDGIAALCGTSYVSAWQVRTVRHAAPLPPTHAPLDCQPAKGTHLPPAALAVASCQICGYDANHVITDLHCNRQ